MIRMPLCFIPINERTNVTNLLCALRCILISAQAAMKTPQPCPIQNELPSVHTLDPLVYESMRKSKIIGTQFVEVLFLGTV
jgi:phage tail sheath gpL-like